MAEEKLIFEKPYYKMELERGQRGAYGWKLTGSGPDLELIRDKLKGMNEWCIDYDKEMRKDIWQMKEKK